MALRGLTVERLGEGSLEEIEALLEGDGIIIGGCWDGKVSLRVRKGSEVAGREICDAIEG